MTRTAQDIMQMIQEQNIKMVDFKIVDINGQFRHVTIPASQFTPDTIKEGNGEKKNCHRVAHTGRESSLSVHGRTLGFI